MKKLLVLVGIIALAFSSCPTPDSNIPEKETLFTTNNSTDNDLSDYSSIFTRQGGPGNGIIGKWIQVYESTTNGEITGRRNTERTFYDTGAFSEYMSSWIRRISSYENNVPIYSWEAVGLPRTQSGKFSIQSTNNIKTISMDVYNYSYTSYMEVYDNTPIHVSDNYLLIGNLTSNSNNNSSHNFTAINGTITNYTGPGGNIIIPSIIDGIPVSTIGARAFIYKSLTIVVIPDSVISIKDWAFHGNELTSVTIPDNVTSIGNQAFQSNKLTSVIIPNKVTFIGVEAFNNNELTSVTIPDNITVIMSGTFANNQLTSVIIPNSVTSIWNSAFRSNQLTSVTIGTNVSLYTETLANYASFGDGFEAVYNNGGKLAGTYTRLNTTSSTKWTSLVYNNTPPDEVSNVSHKVTYYGGMIFSLTRPLDEDLEFVLFIWPWGAEHKYLANTETFETQYGPDQLDYVIIKTIDIFGNVSSGIRYNLK